MGHLGNLRWRKRPLLPRRSRLRRPHLEHGGPARPGPRAVISPPSIPPLKTTLSSVLLTAPRSFRGSTAQGRPSAVTTRAHPPIPTGPGSRAKHGHSTTGGPACRTTPILDLVLKTGSNTSAASEAPLRVPGTICTTTIKTLEAISLRLCRNPTWGLF